MKNANFKKDPITTVLGLILVLAAVAVVLAPAFVDVKKDFTTMWYIPAIIGGTGVLLILSPDTIIRGANKSIDRYSDK
jgi:protein-S-isoprenylcysteine O-methyltransferase Ste14